jgi:hypothetical protein
VGGIPKVRTFLAAWHQRRPHWLVFGSMETDVLKVMYVSLLAEATVTGHDPSGLCRVEFDRCELGRILANDLEIADAVCARIGISSAQRLRRAQAVMEYFGFGNE